MYIEKSRSSSQPGSNELVMINFHSLKPCQISVVSSLIMEQNFQEYRGNWEEFYMGRAGYFTWPHDIDVVITNFPSKLNLF